MSDEKKPLPVGNSKGNIAVDLIWNLLDRESVLPELVREWPGVTALSVRNQLIPAHDPSPGTMPIGFAYFIQKKLRSTGEEHDPFSYRLDPIVEQMERLGIHQDHRTSVLRALLIGDAQMARSNLKRSSLTIEEMIHEVKKKVLFDDEIKDRRVTRWTTVTFKYFHRNADWEEKATRQCLELVNEYQQDLPKHLLAEEPLYNRIRSIFRSIQWCETLFQRTEAHENATWFGQNLIFAAVNHDMRTAIQPKAIISFHATQPTLGCPGKTETTYSDLIAFFSNPPPAPLHRCPGLFNQIKYFRSPHRPFKRSEYSSSRPSWMRPHALHRSRHLLGKYFCDIADAAAYVLSHENQEADKSGHEVRTYFSDAKEELFHVDEQHDEANDALDAWIADMFAVLDKCDLSGPALPLSSSMDQNSYGFFPLSIPYLKDILDTMTLLSSVSADQHLLLDTGARRSICNYEWLQKANWIPLKRIELRTNTPPFRLAGHPVCALYDVQLAATITDHEGRNHILKILTYVLPSTPIPFFLGLIYQRRLGLDTCLREHHSSHLRISARDKVLPLTVTSHVWLRFSPMHKRSADSLDWNEIIEKTVLDTPAAIPQAVTHTMTCIVLPDSNFLPDSVNATYLIPSWRRNTWTPTISGVELFRLRRALKHLENSSMSKVMQKSLGDKPIPPGLETRALIYALLRVGRDSSTSVQS